MINQIFFLRHLGIIWENLECKTFICQEWHILFKLHHDTYIPRDTLTQVIIKINGYILNVVFYVFYIIKYIYLCTDLFTYIHEYLYT